MLKTTLQQNQDVRNEDQNEDQDQIFNLKKTKTTV